MTALGIEKESRKYLSNMQGWKIMKMNKQAGSIKFAESITSFIIARNAEKKQTFTKFLSHFFS